MMVFSDLTLDFGRSRVSLRGLNLQIDVLTISASTDPLTELAVLTQGMRFVSDDANVPRSKLPQSVSATNRLKRTSLTIGSRVECIFEISALQTTLRVFSISSIRHLPRPSSPVRPTKTVQIRL